MKKIVIPLAALFLFSSLLLSAKDNSDKKKNHHKFYDYENLIFWNDFYSPWIEVNYGIGNVKSDNFNNPFKKIGNIQIKFGHSSIDDYDEGIVDYEQNFFFLGSYSDRLKNSSTDNLIRTDSWQFGFGRRTGFGYSFGQIALIPYNQRSIIWTKLIVTDNYYKDILNNPGTSLNPNSFDYDPFAKTLDRFNNNFRFGISAEGGVNLQIGSMFTLGAGYELNTVYPRTVFWKASGSLIIEEIAQGIVSDFVNQIMDSSPISGPIVSFLLKNGLSFVYYSLTKSDMNWPFASENPLTYETVKINIGFTF